YERWLFTYSASLMPSNLVEIFACEMINRTQFYQEIPENRRLVNQMLFNVIVVCIEKNRLSLAFKLLNYADNLKRRKRIYSRAMQSNIAVVIISVKRAIYLG
ncbi:MAG: XRE family transcriptional regulator, partial [Streptococcus sp.]|nr:XRE family transcriptional regulator [Streptococcus sp.]